MTTINSRESIIANAVAKKLKKYLDIQRREQGFDLSDPYHPITEPRPPKIKVKRNNFLNEDDLKHLPKSNLLKHEISRINTAKHLSSREAEARLNMERQMSKYNSPHIVSPYAHIVNPASITSPKKSPKKRALSAGRSPAGRVGRGQRVMRRAPSQKITPAERERIVNLTTKLLVATETIALPQNRKQSKESQTSSEESFPVIPAVRRVQQMRPKSAYSDPGQNISPLLSQTGISSSRTRSAEQRRRIDDDDDSLRNNPGEFRVQRGDQGYIVTKKHSSDPSSILSVTATRPKSAAISSRFKPDKFEDKYEDDEFYDQSSTEVTPVHTPRTIWSDLASDKLSNDIATQTVKTAGTQTNSNSPSEASSDQTFHSRPYSPEHQSTTHDFHTQFTSGEDLLYMKDKLYGGDFEDMSTQTRRRSVEPKLVTYEVYVVTGNKLGASTKSEVKINIFGEHGSTGERKLIKPKLSKTPFQRNQTDVFQLDCMFLGKLTSVRIGHDGTSIGDGWLLNRVAIKEGLKATRAFNFPCNKWLSAKEGDGQIIRDLIASKQIPVSELPAVSSNQKSPRRLSSSEESQESRSSPVKTIRKKSTDSNISKPTKTREYFDKNDSSSSNLSKQKSPSNSSSRNNSFNRKTRSTVQRKHSSSDSSGSYTSTSDSETEKERREMEKRKRREKRLSKDVPNEKAKANLGGMINKVDQANKSKINKRASSDSSRMSQTGSGRDTPTGKSTAKNTKTNSPKKVSQPVVQEKKESPVRKVASPIKTEQKVLDKSLSSDSSSSSTSSDDEIEEKKTTAKNDSDEEKVEFSNKDTKKKYSETIDTDDLYMAGFLAGIKANNDKEEQKEKEIHEKEEFEETLKSGTTIHQACEVGDLDRVKELTELVPDLKTKVDERGWAPIHISAAFGHLDLVKWLSVSGVQLTDETPTGYTAIHLAAMNGHVNCIMILAAMGCPISSRTVDKFTPLHLAAMSGHIECLKWLLSNRAKVDVKDVNGRSPLDLAVEYKHDECIQLLKVMKKELNRKGSVMKMLRDPNALRKTSSIDQPFGIQAQPSRGADSGVGGESNEEEEWVSDTEETSGVIGRGGDERSDADRRTSVQGGRKESVARKQSVGRKTSNTHAPLQRRLSKQEVRHSEELEEKKKNYEEQRRKLETRKTSFLDSIRDEIDDNEDEQKF